MVKKDNTLLAFVIGAIIILILYSTGFLFSLFPNTGCGLVGVIKDNKMCLPNGHWSGILDCTNGKCGIRETTNVNGMCNWLELECRNQNIYMCSRNGVFSSIGKIDGYCGYNTENKNPPPIANCQDNEEMCVGLDYYNCRFNSFTYVGNINGRCGYVSPDGSDIDFFKNNVSFFGFNLSMLSLILIIGGIIIAVLIISKK